MHNFLKISRFKKFPEEAKNVLGTSKMYWHFNKKLLLPYHYPTIITMHYFQFLRKMLK